MRITSLACPFGGVALLLGTCAGCGSSSSSPSSPATTGTSSSTQSVVQVGGDWSVTFRLGNFSGGECVGSIMQDAIGGTNAGTLSVTQSGANLSSTLRTTGGLSCSHTGTAGTSTMTLNSTACTASAAAGLSGLRCANGAVRDLRIVSHLMNVTTIRTQTIAGVTTTNYNIFVAGTQTSVGTMTTNEDLNGTK